MNQDTRLVHAGRAPARNFGIVNPPIYRASTILYPTLAEFERREERTYTDFHYGIDGTPTTVALGEALCELSGGFRSLILSSGLAAVTQTLAAFVQKGDHVLVTDAVYGPTRAFCESILERFGVDVTFYDPLIGGGIAGLIRENTRVVYLESPGSQTFEVQDVKAIAAAARARGVVAVLDNTWATPLHFRAFEHGVDVEVQAATKFIGGHSDLMLGVVTTRTEALFRVIKDGIGLFGDCASPDVCYEALRGLRTMGVRLRHQAASALHIAGWLTRQPHVARVLFPALPGDPGHGLWTRDFLGGSTLFGVILHAVPTPALAAMVEGFRLFKLGASFGGFESLVITARPRRIVRPWAEPGPLLRLHVGLEAVEDLIADLEDGFKRLDAVRAAVPTGESQR